MTPRTAATAFRPTPPLPSPLNSKSKDLGQLVAGVFPMMALLFLSFFLGLLLGNLLGFQNQLSLQGSQSAIFCNLAAALSGANRAPSVLLLLLGRFFYLDWLLPRVFRGYGRRSVRLQRVEFQGSLPQILLLHN